MDHIFQYITNVPFLKYSSLCEKKRKIFLFVIMDPRYTNSSTISKLNVRESSAQCDIKNITPCLHIFYFKKWKMCDVLKNMIHLLHSHIL